MQYRLRSCCPVFRAKTPKHTKVKTRPQNIPCTIHLPTAFPTTNFSPFAPPAFVNSQSTIPPIVKFLPTPIVKKKPNFDCSPNNRTVEHQQTFSDIMQAINNSAICYSWSRTTSVAQALVPMNMNTHLCNNTYLLLPSTAVAQEKYTSFQILHIEYFMNTVHFQFHSS